MLPLRLAKHALWVTLAVLLVGGCSGGCTSGCACEGVTPLPQGFNPDRRIENAAAVRITESGLTFIEENIGPIIDNVMSGEGGIITFPIEAGDPIDLTIVTATVCPDGPNDQSDPPECIAEINLGDSNLHVDSQADHNLLIWGPLKLRIQKLPIDLGWLGDTILVGNGNGACPNDTQSFADIGATVDISIEIDADPQHSRRGYSRVRIGNFVIDEDDVSDALKFCGGGFDEWLLNLLKGLLVGMLVDQMIDPLMGTLEESLCQQANPELDPPCPDGTVNVDGICRYGTSSDDECASIILGMDGTVDLGEMMAGFSPGTKGAFDFLFAAGGHSLRDDASGFHWGDLNPTGQGATLGMYGGVEPLVQSPCVPPANMELPTGIPIPDELTANTIAGWPEEMEGPHIGLAISERFFNFALAGMYNSGALCLGISGSTIPELNSNLLAIALNAESMKEIGWQRQAAELALIVRPQLPPQVTFGGGTDIESDPLLHLVANQMAIDFYMWSSDRYIRAMTVTTDISVPANLDVTPEGLLPVIDAITLTNTTVTNSPLIREDPALIGLAIQDLVTSMVGSMLGGAIPAVDLNGMLESVGLTLVIPPTVEGMGSPGLRRLQKGTDSFLGIFAALGVAEPAAATSQEPDSTVELMSFEPGEGARYADRDARAELRFGSSLDNGSRQLEWQYRVGSQPWHPFTRERSVTVRDRLLRYPGRHLISVRSRIAGQAMTLGSPATIEVVVDEQAPALRVSCNSAGQLLVRAQDLISDDEGTRVRWRWGKRQGDEPAWQAWSEWSAISQLAPIDLPVDVNLVEVQAQDEEGNIGTVSQALIRGGTPADGGGCSCRLAERTRDEGIGGWLIAGLLVMAARWRRRRSPARSRRRSRWAQGGAAIALVGLAGLSGCNCSEDDTTAAPAYTEPGCRGRGDCFVLEPGLVGAYTGAVVAPDGTLWVSGYLEADWEDEYTWGDLVVGRYVDGAVEWKVVDGLPKDEEVNTEYYDPKGFRGGLTESGDDVGRWTTIAVDSAGNPGVAYYDNDYRALRYAHLDGEEWSTAEVGYHEYGDMGRYAKLSFDGDRPVIVYLFVEPGEGGAVRSGVRMATGSSASAADASWSFEDIAVNGATPCTAAWCPVGTKCVADSGLCAEKSNNCDPDCGDTEDCVDVAGTPTCATVVGPVGTETYPPATGLYIATAPRPAGGLGVAFYDRTKGNLVVASKPADQWQTVIADGELPDGTDTGDKGIGASLAIDDQGHFHLAYVDGHAESVNYLMVVDGQTPGTPEIVDNGYTVDGQAHPDGLHIVGDDSNIVFTQSAAIHISYHDATVGALRYAVGEPAGELHNWTLKAVVQEGFAGFFSKQIHYDGSWRILNWSRVGSPSAKGNVRLVSPP